MNNESFMLRTKELFAAFGKNFNAETAAKYFKMFNYLTEQQWSKICDWAEIELDNFPKPKELHIYINSIGFGQKISAEEHSIITIVCVCGGTSTISKTRLLQDSNEPISYYCPMNFYGKCNRKISARFLSQCTVERDNCIYLEKYFKKPELALAKGVYFE
mgnify:CR=1 FL=1